MAARKPLCQVCGEAPIQYQITEARGNEVKTVGICKACAEKRGIRHANGTITVDVKGVMASLMPSAKAPRRRAASACPACGWTLADFERDGRLGCPSCYEAFGRSLGPIVRKVQAGPQHRGLVPHRFAAQADEIRRLREQLDAAVREERYEDAARIRDLLRVKGGR